MRYVLLAPLAGFALVACQHNQPAQQHGQGKQLSELQRWTVWAQTYCTPPKGERMVAECQSVMDAAAVKYHVLIP